MNIILGFIIAFLIFYFIWQFIKRAIFIKIFKTLDNFSQSKEQYDSKTKKNREFKKDIKWDAETVDFEEVPESKE